MRLPAEWETQIQNYFDLQLFYRDLDDFLHQFPILMPQTDLVFNVFRFVKPDAVNCVLYGEDPYPRVKSANGVAFWDQEIQTWHDKTNGNSLKNIMKSLLVYRGLAEYSSPIATCRTLAQNNGFKSPPQLFESWLKQGVLLINSALTFSGPADKKAHFTFWQPFHKALIKLLNDQEQSPSYVLWGRKAQNWESEILDSIDLPAKIIKQGHPTFIHQFLRKNEPHYSPFFEIAAKTGLKWD